MKTITVNLPKDAYKVKIGRNILPIELKNILMKYSETTIFIVTNETIHGLYPDHIQKQLPEQLKSHLLILPDGEKYKNLEILNRIYDFLIDKRANRKSIVIAFGGGVIGDMVGFAAATFMRGMEFIQIPTTLLSQVDSSIGGKTAVNHPKGKNTIGAFKQPKETIIDIEFLHTLPKRELIAGYAELIKHGIIRDKALFDLLEQGQQQLIGLDGELLTESIFRSCSVKARVVEQDEKEIGLRASLNFGHTLGHFLETFTQYEKYLHGETVIAGMDFAAWWSVRHLSLSQEAYLRIHRHLQTLGVTISIPNVEEDVFLELVAHDKKSFANGVTFIGVNGIGEVQLNPGISVTSLWEDFRDYLASKTCLVTQND